MRALVTGAWGGLGRAIVEEFARHGARVGACDREAMVAEPAPPGTTTSAAFDLRDASSIRAGVAAVGEALGGLDVVVANAGVVDTIHRADTFPADAWRSDLEYTAAKAGIVGMARTLAAEWGSLGVRVNVVMPGMIATPKVRALPEEVRSAVAGSLPLRRIGEPGEVASVIAFLAGPGAAYVHGQVLRVDGGMGLMSHSLATGARR